MSATNEIEHLVRNPECFVMVLEPLTEDGLRATALTGRMGDEEVLRWWVALGIVAFVALVAVFYLMVAKPT